MRPHARRVRFLVAVALVPIVAARCIGATDRADFDEADASVATITISLAGGAPTITMRLQSARRTGTADWRGTASPTGTMTATGARTMHRRPVSGPRRPVVRPPGPFVA